MIKKIVSLFAISVCLMFSAVASSAVITTSTEYAFNDVNSDNVFDSADYLTPLYDYTLAVSQFDDNGGAYTLVGAVIKLDGFLEGFFRFENLSATATSEITGTVASQIKLATSTGIELVTILPSFSTTVLATVFDGKFDFDGTSGGNVTASPVPVTSTNTVTVTDASTLALFLGSGTIDLNVSGDSRATTTNIGGTVATENGVVSAGTFEIFYQYEAANVSVAAPNMLMLMGLVVLFVGFRTRKHA